uniref:protein-tyrosine-phosphatase n=1 Tax=Romanomermis culicivorax TaxID=13658 RepID=A0A915K8C0_ROMCU
MSAISTSRRLLHSKLNGQQAVQLLKSPNIPEGTFLFRPSSTAGDFALSVRCDNTGYVTSIRITKNADDCYQLNGYNEAFASLSELIQHCIEMKVLNLSNGTKVELKNPYYTTDLTPERWFHAGIDGIQAEQLLREQGKNGSFLVRESQRSAGSYAITLRTDDPVAGILVTHIMINTKNHKFDVGGGDQFDSLTDLIENYKRHAMVETSGRVVHLKYPFNSTRIWGLDLKKKIEFMEKADASRSRTGFWEEFEAVQQNECKHWYSRRAGQRLENRAKNRFKNILPYDHTRVVLKVEECNDFGDDKCSAIVNAGPKSCSPTRQRLSSYNSGDYINANHIQILSEYEEFSGIQKSYISCQGCLPNTVDDFWRMIWQEKCPVIVMTTKEIERSKSKCAKYWPDVGTSRSFGLNLEFSVTCQTENVKADYVCRKLTVRKNREERVVCHYQFITWPDHGVPADPASVLNFLEEMNDYLDNRLSSPYSPLNYPNGPLCVHCSAGIGRSGTFIAIDLILSQLKKYGLNTVIDISRTVQMIRTQRSGM